MSFAPTEAMMAYLQKLQAEGKLIVPADLVRMVKAGPRHGESRRGPARGSTAGPGTAAD